MASTAPSVFPSASSSRILDSSGPSCLESNEEPPPDLSLALLIGVFILLGCFVFTRELNSRIEPECPCGGIGQRGQAVEVKTALMFAQCRCGGIGQSGQVAEAKSARAIVIDRKLHHAGVVQAEGYLRERLRTIPFIVGKHGVVEMGTGRRRIEELDQDLARVFPKKSLRSTLPNNATH